ncbi:hypothetical protein MKW94_016561 [Papaver nudicaule]|uniref:Uncharacterized protein n=1 Tax=Papaver nudicaule TaxID=74823 RepID=A0AA41V225_PAPNU|nr:hypothetical protein [Papaver nudicaule]
MNELQHKPANHILPIHHHPYPLTMIIYWHALVHIIEELQKCHVVHPYTKFFHECTNLKIKLVIVFKAVERKQCLQESKNLKGRLQKRNRKAEKMTENMDRLKTEDTRCSH